MIQKTTWLPYVLGVMFFSGLVVLLGMQINSSMPHCDIDSKAHYLRAERFIQTGSVVDPASPALPFLGLGYAWFIILIYSLFGSIFNAIVFVQIVLAIFNFIIIGAISRELFSLRASLIGFLLGCCNVGYIVFAQFVLTEILLATFLAMAFLCLLRPQSTKNAILAGLLLGFSIFIKPVALYFAIPMALVWFFQHKKNAVLFLCCFFGGVGVVKVHNYVLFDTWKFGDLASWNLCYAYNSYFLAYENGTDHDHEYRNLVEQTGGEIKPALLMPALKQRVLCNPVGAVWCWLLNMFKTCLGMFSTNMKVLIGSAYSGEISFFKVSGNLFQKIKGYLVSGAHKPWVLVVGIYEASYIILCYCSAGIGLFALWQGRKNWYQLALIVLFFSYFVAITGHDGCARYRMMVEFLLLSLAAGGIDYLLRMRKSYLKD